MRRLLFLLGDQLDQDAPALTNLDPQQDLVLMAEVAAESSKVWSGKPRIVMFLAAMRHFTAHLRAAGLRVDYITLDAPDNTQHLAGELARAVARHRPACVDLIEPGEFQVRAELLAASEVPVECWPDTHFLDDGQVFRAYAANRREFRLEYFYRDMRRHLNVLMTADGRTPLGGRWNFDAENRGAFGNKGPGLLPAPIAFAPDATTRSVIDLVETRFPDHPGALPHFDWPVTRSQAQAALDDFIAHRLPEFGRYQDAMWTDEPWLYHARIAAAMNLKLLNPRTVIAAALTAFDQGQAPLAAVEGFIRQILGWREYVRAVYWRFMPDYLQRNALAADQALPSFYWHGRTAMTCLRHVIRQSLDLGYAHHIQRLMVTGLYALLLGVRPSAVHQWYLAVYVDAVEWVELPNTLGMSQYADDGVMASKPYIASGQYIASMSNYCRHCPFDPAQALGPRACPVTTLYWNFLDRHRARLQGNPRMRPQLNNLARKSASELAAIAERAAEIRAHDGEPAAPSG